MAEIIYKRDTDGLLARFLWKGTTTFSPKFIMYDNKTALQFSILAKIRYWNSAILMEQNYAGYWGGSIGGNSVVSKDITFIDILSFHCGLLIRTNNYQNQFNVELDGGLKYFFYPQFQYNNKDVVCIQHFEEEAIEDTLSFLPFQLSFSYERYLSDAISLNFQVGLWYFLNVGDEKIWYYKEDIDYWNSGEPIPQPIGREPDNPIFDGIIPYIGCGIRF